MILTVLSECFINEINVTFEYINFSTSSGEDSLPYCNSLPRPIMPDVDRHNLQLGPNHLHVSMKIWNLV